MKVVGGVVSSLCFAWFAWALVPAAIADPGSEDSNSKETGAAVLGAEAPVAADSAPANPASQDSGSDEPGTASSDEAVPAAADLESENTNPPDTGTKKPASKDSPAYTIDIVIREVGPAKVDGAAGETATANEAPTEDGKRPAFELLGQSVPSGKTRRLKWSGIESFVGDTASTPVLVAHGKKDGPILCLSAAVHGDELNGIEIVRRVMHDLDAEKLSGTVIGVPIVNVYGFQRASRYLPDRRDLNRYFPGTPTGSSASRIAHAFFEGVIRRCDMLVDIHTGSFHRTNLTQLRADISREDVRELCAGFGDMPVLHNVGSPGTLRRAATDAGIPTVTIEAGEPMRLEAKVVNRGVAGIDDLLANTKMVKTIRLFGSPQPLFYRSTWVRSDSGGILFSFTSLGDIVDAGDELGIVTDPITNLQSSIRTPYSGTVLGMAVNQFVMPGFAVFRVGIKTSGEEIGKTGPPPTLGTEPSLDGLPPSDSGLEFEERPE